MVISDSSGVLKSVSLGGSIALGWTPCIGPILGLLLTLAANSENAATGALLLFSFGMGLGVWFIVLALVANILESRINQSSIIFRILRVLTGLGLVTFGLLILIGGSDQLLQVSTRLASLGGVLPAVEGYEGNFRDSVDGGILGIVISFAAGVMAFLSPCVLPLVPIFLLQLGDNYRQPMEEGQKINVKLVRNTVVFVATFALVFAMMGASVGWVGNTFLSRIDWVLRPIGLVILIFGLHSLNLVRLPFLDRTYRLRNQ